MDRLLRPLNLFVTVVLAAGAVAALAAAGGYGTGLPIRDHLPEYLALSALLVVGELRVLQRIRLAPLSFSLHVWGAPSTTFVFALLLLFGLPGMLVVHAAASLTDDLTLRRSPLKALFNVSQYAIAAAATAFVLNVVGWPLADGRFTAGDLVPAACAAVTYFVINNLLVGVVVGLVREQPVVPTAAATLRREAPMEMLLLGLGPLAATLAIVNPVLLPLLLLPTLTVFVSSRAVLEIERRARVDALTGLPNRSGFRADIEELFTRNGPRGAFVLLDLDGFKEVNDTLGHAVGDQLLVEVGRRLESQLGPGEQVGRLGGDEFVVYAAAVLTEKGAVALAEGVIERLAEPFVVDQLELSIEASAGVSVAPVHGRTTDDLLRRAEIALYLAKPSPEQVHCYDPSRDQHSRRRLRLLGELRNALTDDQLFLHYQPQADLATGEVVGVEALVRWRHPELGLIPPNEFIPQAEHSALIGQLTRWVIDAAAAELRRQLDQRRVIQMAVNVSPRALHDLSLPVDVAEILHRHGVPAGMLTCEVTESALADLGPASRVLNTLATMGIGVAIDDFGTGYSSLSYLKHLPVSELKIDRTFVQGLRSDGHDAAIVRSIVALARDLRLVSVAEGVESEDDEHALRQLGCDRIQGYLLAKPMSADDLDGWLAARTPVRQEA